MKRALGPLCPLFFGLGVGLLLIPPQWATLHDSAIPIESEFSAPVLVLFCLGRSLALQLPGLLTAALLFRSSRPRLAISTGLAWSTGVAIYVLTDSAALQLMGRHARE